MRAEPSNVCHRRNDLSEAPQATPRCHRTRRCARAHGTCAAMMSSSLRSETQNWLTRQTSQNTGSSGGLASEHRAVVEDDLREHHGRPWHSGLGDMFRRGTCTRHGRPTVDLGAARRVVHRAMRDLSLLDIAHRVVGHGLGRVLEPPRRRWTYRRCSSTPAASTTMLLISGSFPVSRRHRRSSGRCCRFGA